MSARPLPPYSIELQRWLQADKKPARWGCSGSSACITVAIGSDAWSWAKQRHEHRLVLCLPPGENASRFNWRDCSGHDPILLQQCGTVADGVIENLTRALLRDGCQRVLDVDTMNRFTAEAVQDVAA